MQNQIALSCSVVLIGLTACADVLVGPEDTFVTNVTDDVVQSERILVYGGGQLLKKGGGTWSLPVGVVEERAPFAATVVSGKVDFAETSVSLGTPTLPSALTAKASLWVDASLYDTKPYLFTGATSNDHTYVDRWYDARETEESVAGTPLRSYCQAYDRRPGTSTLYYDLRRTDGSKDVYSPEIVRTNGLRAIWFGGVSSSRNYMWIKKDRTSIYKPCITSAFIVHGVFESLGNLLGVEVYGVPWVFTGSCNGSLGWRTAPILQPNCAAVHAGAQLYVNGAAIGLLEIPYATEGFQLFELTRHNGFYANSFFNERYISSNATSGDRNGGDFICEALVFTTELTSTERAQVTAYLMAKWGLKGRTDKTLTVARAGELSLDADGGGQAATNLTLVGSGTVRKTGQSTLTNATVGHGVFTGAVALEAGALDTVRPLAVAVADGTTVDSATHESQAVGNRMTLGAAAAGSLVKTGSGEATVTGVPATVSRVTVSAGTLKVRPVKDSTVLDEAIVRAADDPDVVYYNGFEGWANEYTTGYWDDGWWYSNERCGFKYVSPPYKADGSLADARYYHVINGHFKDADGNPKDPSGWGFPYNSTGDGDGYIAWRYAPAYATEVTFSEAGEYEVSFALAARQNNGNRPVFVELMTTDLKWTNTFHMSWIPSWSHGNVGTFNFDKATFTVASAGKYYLGFRNHSGADLSTCLDAVTVRRVRATADLRQTGWSVPGGDFGWQFVTNTPNACTYAEMFTNTIAGWNFETPCTRTNVYYAWPSWRDLPTATVITRLNTDSLNNSVALFIDGLGAENFAHAFFPADGATIRTTFTPPKGVWRVAADMAVATSPDYHGKVVGKAEFRGTLATGGANVDLGAIVPNVSFSSFAFAPVIVADGETPWTVSVAFDTSAVTDASALPCTGAALDNLRLVNALGAGGALLDPSFETMAPWTVSGAFASTDPSGTEYESRAVCVSTKTSAWTQKSYGTGADEYPDGGTNMIRLIGRGFASQSVGLMPGRYRLSFYARSCWQPAQPTWYGVYGQNPVAAYLAKDGVTNILTVASCAETNLVEHVAEFQIVTAGTYAFGFEGLSGAADIYPIASDGVHARQSLVDSVSIQPVDDPSAVTFGANPEVRVAAGARLELDYNGTNAVSRLRLGSRRGKGVVSAATDPDYISGTGALVVEPKPRGIVIFVR